MQSLISRHTTGYNLITLPCLCSDTFLKLDIDKIWNNVFESHYSNSVHLVVYMWRYINQVQ